MFNNRVSRKPGAIHYEHRRQWVVDRLGQLSRIFAIGICTYLLGR